LQAVHHGAVVADCAGGDEGDEEEEVEAEEMGDLVPWTVIVGEDLRMFISFILCE
jgi:hypothetical protein